MIRNAAIALGLIAALLVAGLPSAGASELLTNGGFEQGSGGWSLNAGALDAVASPVHSGSLAGVFAGSGQPTTQFVYQLVNVQPGQNYELSGWILATESGTDRIFLRVSWFDASGQLVLSEDSPWLTQLDAGFQPLTTGVRVSPLAARQARVSLLVQADSQFIVHLDDFAFSGPAVVVPPATITPNPPTTTATPIAPPVSPTGTPKPVPSATRTPSPTRTPAATGGATPIAQTEPSVFQGVTNGGFEQLRPDGTPYGWRKLGGEMGTVTEPRSEGSRAAFLSSSTSSTKWLYQTISVRGGAYYEAAVQALAGSGAEAAFLRLSWYASADGSGQAIDSVDSLATATPERVGFQQLATGPVQAPAKAASAKFRLMLRAASEQPAVAYFDAATFGLSQPGGDETVSAPGGAVAALGRERAGVVVGGEDVLPVPTSTPMSLVNVKPQAADESAVLPTAGAGRHAWAILLAIGVAVAAVSLAGAYDLWQRRAQRGAGTETED